MQAFLLVGERARGEKKKFFTSKRKREKNGGEVKEGEGEGVPTFLPRKEIQCKSHHREWTMKKEKDYCRGEYPPGRRRGRG